MDIVEDVLAPVVSRIRFGVNVRQLLRHPTRLHDIAFSPAFPTDQTAFVTVKNYLLRTDDGGESWRVTNINDDPWGVQAFMGTAQNLTGYVIALSPTFETDDTLFIGMQDGALGVSTDRGDSLKIISTVADKLTSLKISPDFDTDGVLFATGYHSGVHKSTDGGITWASANQGLNIESVTVFIPRPQLSTDTDPCRNE